MFHPVVEFTDATALVIGHLNDALTSPVSRTVPNPRPASFVTVLRTGGAVDPLPLTEGAQLTIEAWSTSAPNAYLLASDARLALHQMAGTVVDGVAVYRVEEAAGPQDLPDPESTQARYTFTVIVHLRGQEPHGS